MIKNITEKMKNCPSYFRWSDKRLANYFGCSERTIKTIKMKNAQVGYSYERSLGAA